MERYLALDCGGTKVAAILYGENMQRLGTCVTGSVRENTTSAALIGKHTQTLIETLGLAGQALEACAGVYPQHLFAEISRVCTVKRRGISGELELGLAAAGVFGDGILALCGTGATVFARIGEKRTAAGGYGAAVADEGSGYYIGRAALIAAIRNHEGRGDKTALTHLLPAHFGFTEETAFRDAIFSVYGQTARSPAASVAACVPVVVRAAAQGDAVAAEILRDAGRLLGEQTLYLIRETGAADNMPLALSGSVWRGNPILFRAFRETVLAQSPMRPVVVPRLEPVLGVLARQIYEKNGTFTAADAERLRAEYPEFRYDIDLSKEATICC